VRESLDESSPEKQASAEMVYKNFIMADPGVVLSPEELAEKLTELETKWLRVKGHDADAPGTLMARATRLLPSNESMPQIEAFAGQIRALSNVKEINASFESFKQSTIETYRGVLNAALEKGADLVAQSKSMAGKPAVNVHVSSEAKHNAEFNAKMRQMMVEHEARVAALVDGKTPPVPGGARKVLSIPENKCTLCIAAICVCFNFSLPVREPAPALPQLGAVSLGAGARPEARSTASALRGALRPPCTHGIDAPPFFRRNLRFVHL
jgi:hypothetical protein